MNVLIRTRPGHRRSAMLIGAVSALFGITAEAALVQLNLVGGTDNTFVGSGDPCDTGLSGGNACNSQTMTVSLLIDTANTTADLMPADPADGYYNAVAPPGFITGSATINGNVFSIPATFVFNFAQTNQVRDNYFGLDQFIFGIDGGNMTERFSLGGTLNLTGNPFSGDSLEVIAGLGNVSLYNNMAFGTFNFTGAAGQVQGNYVIGQASFAPVPAPAAGWLLATGVAAALRYRRRTR